ncbi:MAG: hypothetical protein WC714_18995 [Candidatus Obscuribacterales bacterium]
MVTQSDAALNTSPSSSSAVAIAYARMRRWLGIGYVGMVTASCLLVLCFGFASKFFSTTSQPTTNLTSELICAILVFSFCSLPFDVVGFNIEKLYGRTCLTLPSFLLKQISAVFRYDLVLLAMALSLASVWANFGLVGLSVSSVLLSLLLISTQLLFVRFYGGVLSERVPSGQLESALDGASANHVVLVQTDQRTFSGGIVGLPGFEKIVIPKWWLADFSTEQLRAVLTRRSLIITSGGRFRGVMLALVFTNIGILLAAAVTTLHFALPLNSAAGVMTMSALFTIWSFWGLLILPQFSHAGVYEADRLALEAGVDKEVLLQAIVKIDGHLEDEQERSPAVDTIFHPVPTIAHRLSALASSVECKQGAWQTARYAVFLSVIGLSLLGRAVHCNAGKPELWAMLPAD